jgi:branched-chain amino acid transport system substrate-binding protein
VRVRLYHARGRVLTTYFDENLVAALPTEHTTWLYACMDYYQSVSDPFSRELLGRYNTRFLGHDSAGTVP